MFFVLFFVLCLLPFLYKLFASAAFAFHRRNGWKQCFLLIMTSIPYELRHYSALNVILYAYIYFDHINQSLDKHFQ